jgi:hypothetical protein
VPVGDELVAGQVGQPPLQAAQRLFAGLAFQPLPLVVEAARGVGVADLGDRHHVQRVAGPPVPGPGQPVADLVSGGDAGRRGAVIAGEGVLGGEPGHIANFSQDPPGDHRPDAIQPGQARAGRGDESGDLGRDELQPGI